MIDLYAGLNPAQREAIDVVEGPLLVLAGPGSGKTRVITHRIARLITSVGIPAQEILAVTFTNKAADEMRRRLGSLVPGQRPWACTFHSLAARLLRQYADAVHRTPKFSILDQSDRKGLLTRIIKEQKVDPTHVTPDAIERRISKLKNDLVTAATFAETAADYFDRVVADIYPIYEESLREQDAVDFDDLLLLLANLLKADESIRAGLDRRFRYVLVDEYQDTNFAQYAIARGLSVDHPNLCVTGDPDQSIYSWRGANLDNILNFEVDFPGAKVIRLEQNYRSTSNILTVADELIRNNTRRKDKALTTANPAGKPVTVHCFKDERAEANHLANVIRQHVDQGVRRYRDFAIFIRVSSLSRSVETAFRQRNIPYQVVGGFSFFERKEIRDILGYARVILNPRDDSALRRVINTPPRGIGETTVSRLADYARSRGTSLRNAIADIDQIKSIRGKSKDALRRFRDLLSELDIIESLAPDAALETIVEKTEYSRLLEHGEEQEQQERLGNLHDLIADARRFAAENPEADLVAFLETISLASDGDLLDERANSTTIMTLHAAKGLEFPVVFLIAFEHEILPHERALRDRDDEEERRLAFVGITRAEEELHLSYCRQRTFQGRTTWRSPSVFLTELPPEPLDRQDVVAHLEAPMTSFEDFSQESGYEEPSLQIITRASGASPSDRFAQGMLVEHPEYGVGKILKLDGVGDNRKATVHFSTVGTRRFVLSQSALVPTTADFAEDCDLPIEYCDD